MKKISIILSFCVCILTLTAQAQYLSGDNYGEIQSHCQLKATAAYNYAEYKNVGSGHVDILRVSHQFSKETAWSLTEVETFFVRSQGYRRCPVDSSYRVDQYEVLSSSESSRSHSDAYEDVDAQNSSSNLRVYYSCWQEKDKTVQETDPEMKFQLCEQATRCLSYLAGRDPYDLQDESSGVLLLQRLAALVSLRNCSVR